VRGKRRNSNKARSSWQEQSNEKQLVVRSEQQLARNKARKNKVRSS